MKLAHPFIENHIIFAENKINVLVVENQSLFVNMIEDIKNQLEQEEGEFVLSNQLGIIPLRNNAELISNYFDLDFDSKKIQNKISAFLKETAYAEENYVKTNEIISMLQGYFYELLDSSEYPLKISNETDAAALIKMAGIKADISNGSLLEKLTDYILLMQDMQGIKLFVFVNLKTFLSERELQNFYSFLFYKKAQVLLLENTAREKLPEEVLHIIDQDMCEIL